jgi:hypothetical protein
MKVLRAGSAFSLVCALVLAASTVGAQTVPAAAPPKRPKAWKFDPRLQLVAEYDDNIYLLPANKLDDPGAPSAADLASGRYTGMEAAADIITSLSASLAMQGSGLGGRDFTITPRAGYEFFARNGERSNATVGLTLEQLLRRDGRLRLRADYQPGYFSRNYLADAVDANANGTITADERVYARGEYHESELQADYRLRLAKSTRSHPFGAWLIVGAGYASRAYDAPFSARDFTGPTAVARLQFDLASGVELTTSYDLAVLGSDVTSQVILLDEPVYGEDLNGNGNSSDLNARAVRTVDRSRTEHVIGESARFGMGKDTDVALSVDYRMRRFGSDEPYDVANNGRKDHRVRFGADLSHKFSKAVRMFAGASYGSQGLNRRTDLGAEGAVDDYTKLRAHAGVRLTR